MSEDTQEHEDQTSEVPSSALDARKRIIAELAAKVNTGYAESGEFADLNAAAPAPSAEPTEQVESEPTAAAPVTEPEPEPKQEPALVTIKVDGVEMQVPKERVDEAGGVRALQMELAAEKRLEETKRLLQEVKAQRQPAPEPEPAKPADDLVKLVMDGPFNEDAARKVAEILSAKPAPPVDLDARIEARLAEKEMHRKFQTDYADIVADPYLLELAKIEESKARGNGDTRPPLELWAEIGTKLRAWRGQPKPAADLTAKVERKQTITNVPSAGAKVPPPETPKERTPSDIVNDIRRARHQRIE